MPDHTLSELHLRLKNCLDTILELEPDLEKLELGRALAEEYSLLKNFVEKLSEVLLEEDDVSRIECATENFLKELKSPLAKATDPAPKGRYVPKGWFVQ